MGGSFFGGQLFAATQLGQHVVHAGHGQSGMLCLLTFAVGVEGFGQFADVGFLLFGAVGEGEGFEGAD